MIEHVVMWNVRGESSSHKQAAVDDLKRRFESLRGQILLEIGINISDVDDACDVVLYSEFENHAALEAYAVHPAHTSVRDALGNVRIARYQVEYEPKVAHLDRGAALRPDTAG